MEERSVMTPILSICIPTRNRANILKNTLLQITNEKIFLNTNKVEIVISDNCSDDNTQEICLEFEKKYSSKFKYIRQTKDLKDKNFIEILKFAKGKYAKLHNDNLYFNANSLENFVKILENSNKDLYFIEDNNNTSNQIKETNYKNFNDFIENVTFQCTWIGGFCVKTEKYLALPNPDRFSGLKLPQVDIIARLSKNGIYLIQGNFMNAYIISKKGGYNVAEIFGQNFILILQQLMQEGFLNKKTYNKVIKKTLIKHTNNYYFDYGEKFGFDKTGYFKYLFKFYKYKPYFYLSYILLTLKNFSKIFYKIKKTETYKQIILLSLIKFKINNKYSKKRKWRKLNKHNKTSLANTFKYERISVGKGTYGKINAIFSNDGPEKLIIGNYCSIASGVQFIVSSEHFYKGLSTYPFKVLCLGEELEAGSKGSIIIKDDVWIANDAKILSGVTVEQGAIVGAGAVVAKNVPPYAIVVGNPAQIVKYRFEPEIIEKLLKFDFSKLTEAKIKQLSSKLYTEINKNNVDKLLEEFNKDVQ